MRYEMPSLRRFVAKLVHDVLPAALASVIGGLVFTHFQLGHQLGHAPERAVAAPASAEMMQLLRDEHGLILNFLKDETAKEKAQFAAAEAAPPSAAVAVEPPAGIGAPRQSVVAMTVPKAAAPRSKAPVVGASLPPLVIAQAQQSEEFKPVARSDDSLLAKTIGLKDHMIAATQRAVSAIGGIPSWIGSIGDHIGGQDASPRPPADLVSAS